MVLANSYPQNNIPLKNKVKTMAKTREGRKIRITIFSRSLSPYSKLILNHYHTQLYMSKHKSDYLCRALSKHIY